jgi:hypothetical protein
MCDGRSLDLRCTCLRVRLVLSVYRPNSLVESSTMITPTFHHFSITLLRDITPWNNAIDVRRYHIYSNVELRYQEVFPWLKFDPVDYTHMRLLGAHVTIQISPPQPLLLCPFRSSWRTRSSLSYSNHPVHLRQH